MPLAPEEISATSSDSSAAPLRAVLRVTSGNLLEQFDFFLFGLYASLIAQVFFPPGDAFAALMMTFSVFGAGFLMRPLGAVLLGAYADRVGRRRGLLVSLALMALATLMIACVPGYASIGLLAPLLVLFGRLLQGFSAGAEFGGVAVYLSEIAPAARRGVYTCWQSASQQAAIAVAAALGYVLHRWMTPQQLLDWGWRVPFLVGCLIVPLLWRLRRSLPETGSFVRLRHHTALPQQLRLLCREWRLLGAGVLLTGLATSTFYFITVYTPTLGRALLQLSEHDGLLLTLLVALTNFCWLPLGGTLADRIGSPPVLRSVALLALLTAYPVLRWLAAAPDMPRMLLVLLWFSFVYGCYTGALVTALIDAMPQTLRVAGFSLAFTLSTAVFGGFTPAIATWLTGLTGDRAAPGWWLTFTALCSLGAAWSRTMARSAQRLPRR